MNLSFSPKILAEVCNRAQVLIKRSPTLERPVSTKTKCIKLIFMGKITFVPVAFLMALSIYQIKPLVKSVYQKNNFLFLNQNICCGYSKELSQ